MEPVLVKIEVALSFSPEAQALLQASLAQCERLLEAKAPAPNAVAASSEDESLRIAAWEGFRKSALEIGISDSALQDGKALRKILTQIAPFTKGIKMAEFTTDTWEACRLALIEYAKDKSNPPLVV